MLKDGTSTFAVIYFLTAQLDPRDDEFYADKKAELSLCRDERVIVVYRKNDNLTDMFGSSLVLNQDSLTQRLDAKVGGVLGIAADPMTAFISLKKFEFSPNEDILITYNIDNSKCAKEIKSIKVKLHREIAVFRETGKKAPIYSKNEYLEEIK